MNKKQYYHRLLIFLPAIVAGALVLCHAGIALHEESKRGDVHTPADVLGRGMLFESRPLSLSTPLLSPASTLLDPGEDAGWDYLDSMIFFGESTTAHLRARGVLTGGQKTTQVWADESGTKRLSSRLLSEPILYPPTGEHLTLAEAVKREKPTILVLSFGLNGITDFIGNKSLYVNNYNKLILAVREASPSTNILLQTVYPVTADCSLWQEDGKTVSSYTQTLNDWICEIAASHKGVRVVDTASVLRGADGCLCKEYDHSGDGVHLTADAYRSILRYLRTHPWVDDCGAEV